MKRAGLNQARPGKAGSTRKTGNGRRLRRHRDPRPRRAGCAGKSGSQTRAETGKTCVCAETARAGQTARAGKTCADVRAETGRGSQVGSASGGRETDI